MKKLLLFLLFPIFLTGCTEIFENSFHTPERTIEKEMQTTGQKALEDNLGYTFEKNEIEYFHQEAGIDSLVQVKVSVPMAVMRNAILQSLHNVHDISPADFSPNNQDLLGINSKEWDPQSQKNLPTVQFPFGTLMVTIGYSEKSFYFQWNTQ